MKHLIVWALALWSMSVFAQAYKYPVPKDQSNTPIYGGLGLPFYSTVTCDQTTYSTAYATVPLTGNDLNRQYRSVYAYNPSATRTVYVCFGDSSGCSVDQIKLNPGYGMVLDGVYYGTYNGITRLYCKLDSAGSVSVDFSGW